MSKTKIAGDLKDEMLADIHVEHDAHDAHSAPMHHDPIDEAPNDQSEIVATAATVAVVAVGAVLFEAALLPGIALGVVAALAPRVMPNVGAAMQPMFRSAVRGAYKVGQRTREMVAEAQEHVSDIVAETQAEEHGAHSAAVVSKPAA